MLIVIFSLLVLFVGILLGKIFNWDNILSLLFTISGALVSSIVLCVLIINLTTNNNYKQSNQIIYDSLVWELENRANDPNYDSSRLYERICEWNKDLANGKMFRSSIWTNWFAPQFYDGFDFIDYTGLEE